jgi:outer membrane protein assembly factor BamB
MLRSEGKEDAVKSASGKWYLVPVSVLLLSLLFAVGCGERGSKQTYDWPRWRGPDGNGVSRESEWDPEALSGGPRVLWKNDIGLGHSSVIIKDNRLYTMGQRGGKIVVSCLQADTGKGVWQFSFDGSKPTQSTPAMDDSSVYVVSTEGVLCCLNIRSGKLRWKKDLVGEYGTILPFYGYAASPVVEGNLLILTADASGMALERQTGKLVWSSEKPPKAVPAIHPRETTGVDYSTPVVYGSEGKRYALVSSWKGLSSVHAASGEVLWRYEWGLYRSYQAADPVLVGDTVFVSFDRTAQDPIWAYSVLLEVTGAEPTVRWKSPDLYTEITSPVAVNGFIYGCQEGPYVKESSLRCIDLQTGRLRWEKRFSEDPVKKSVSLMAADDKLIILTDTGTLAVAQATSTAYSEISRCDVYEGKDADRRFWTAPILCNGRIYCRNFYGDLLCIDVRQE